MKLNTLRSWLQHWIVYSIVIALYCACSNSSTDDNKKKGEENQLPDLSVPVQEFIVPAEAGIQELVITCTPDSWQAETTTGSEWCVAYRQENILRIEIDKNPNIESREAEVSVRAGSGDFTITKVIRVVQLGARPTISITPEALAFGEEGGIQYVNIDTPAKEWTPAIIRGEEWCRIQINGNTLKVTADPNPTTDLREALISVTAVTTDEKTSPVQASLKVSQTGSEAILQLSTEVLSFAAGGESRSLTVISTDPDWEVILPDNAWCDYQREDNQLLITAGQNQELQSRRLEMQIRTATLSRTVTLIQNGVEPQLEVTPDLLRFDAGGGMKTVSVITNAGQWTADIPQGTAWCEVIPDSRTLTIIVSDNPENTNRSVTITIRTAEGGLSAEINVQQNAYEQEEPIYQLEGIWKQEDNNKEANWIFSAQGKLQIISLYGNEAEQERFNYSINKDQLSINSDKYTGYTILPESDNRIVLNGTNGNRIILERIPEPLLLANKELLRFSADNPMDSIRVESNTIWGITGQPEWLFPISTGGKGNGTVSFLVNPENPSQDYQGSFTLYNGIREINIRVEYRHSETENLSVTPSSLQAGAEASVKEITIASGSSWVIENIPSWITAEPMFGTGNSKVTLHLDANPETIVREAQLQISTDHKTVTLGITQEALTESLEVDVTNFAIEAAGSEETLQLNSTTDWEISNIPDWISFSQTTGKGNLLLRMKVTPNTSGTSRTARVKVTAGSKSVTILVSQKAVKTYSLPLILTGEASGCGQSVAGRHLFAVQVMNRTKNSNENYTPYGYGLFDDSASIRLELEDAYEYKITATLALNGKDRIYEDNGYQAPFRTSSYPAATDRQGASLTNRFIKNNERQFSDIGMGTATLSDGKTYSRPDLRRYYGEMGSWTPSSDSPLEIDMTYVSFGFACEVTGMSEEGTIRVEIDGAPAFRFGKNENYSGASIFTLANSNGKWTTTGYSETCGVRLVLETPDGKARTLHYSMVTFKANTQTKLTAKYAQDGFSFDWETGEMTDRDNGSFDANVWW